MLARRSLSRGIISIRPLRTPTSSPSTVAYRLHNRCLVDQHRYYSNQNDSTVTKEAAAGHSASGQTESTLAPNKNITGRKTDIRFTDISGQKDVAPKDSTPANSTPASGGGDMYNMLQGEVLEGLEAKAKKPRKKRTTTVKAADSTEDIKAPKAQPKNKETKAMAESEGSAEPKKTRKRRTAAELEAAGEKSRARAAKAGDEPKPERAPQTKENAQPSDSTPGKKRSLKTVQFNRNLLAALTESFNADGSIAPRSENDVAFQTGQITAQADTSRMNIVSDILCEDVLERLGPSLEKHKGCDIIDINPGIAKWSTKLHDHLKPRNHILMEPDEVYNNHLTLLEASDPTYKLIKKSGIIWNNLTKLITDGLLPSQVQRPFGDSELDKPNDTLLVTINIGYYPRRSYIGFASIAHLVMHQLFTAARAHSLFQSYGQVRMLVWVQDFEKRTFLPRSLKMRNKAAVEAETTVTYLHEICGADQDNDRYQRDQSVEIESALKVSQRMKDAGISTPPHRMSRLEEQIQGLDPNSVGEMETWRNFHAEMDELEQKLMKKEVPILQAPDRVEYMEDLNQHLKQRGWACPEGYLSYLTPEFKRWKELMYRHANRKATSERNERLCNAYKDMESRWLELKKSNDKEKEEKMRGVEEEIEQWHEEVEGLNQMQLRDLNAKIADTKSIAQEPPVLQWDRRAFEPLITKNEEFWPRQPMALLDIMPKTIWPALQKNSLNDYDYYELLLSALFHLPTHSITSRLQALAPGADEWIIPRCPSFRDVESGGFADLEMLKIRNLNEKMLKECFESFMDWPFRPSKGRLLQAMGSQDVHDESAVDDEHLKPF